MDEKQGAPVGYSAPPGYSVPPQQQQYPPGGQPGYPPAQYQGQPTAVAYTGQGQPNVVIMQAPPQEPPQSFTTHIILSCFVFCCCGWLCGIFAFITAMVAKSRADSGMATEARSMGKVSMGLSVAGLVIGILLIVIIIILYFTGLAFVHHASSICRGGYC